jgi:hypothetical protein
MKKIENSEVLLVFTYAPAGLGHLRVTDALVDGLPEKIDSVLLGASDTRITFWHRLMSVHPLVREGLEWLQTNENSYWFYDLYIWISNLATRILYGQMKNLLAQQWHEKKVVVVVATHFGLAHQLANIKTKLEKDFGVKIVLAVQVTDATSMAVWYVPVADLICVPSKKVKSELEEYAKKRGLKKTKIEVLPYPLSKKLEIELTKSEFETRLSQYSDKSNTKIKISMPISGAAVGLEYYDQLIAKLRNTSKRYEIRIVTKDNLHTQGFINKNLTKSGVKVISDLTDKRVVDNYEKLYADEVIGLEVVKPSEQAFKTMFSPDQRGGAILLLTQPVGKQEHDNLDFLLDHKLIPDENDQQKLEKFAMADKMPNEEECRECIERARLWKAIRLTNDPASDARLINWCIKVGVFEKMSQVETKTNLSDPELASNGVEQFWKMVAKTATEQTGMYIERQIVKNR